MTGWKPREMFLICVFSAEPGDLGIPGLVVPNVPKVDPYKIAKEYIEKHLAKAKTANKPDPPPMQAHVTDNHGVVLAELHPLSDGSVVIKKTP